MSLPIDPNTNDGRAVLAYLRGRTAEHQALLNNEADPHKIYRHQGAITELQETIKQIEPEPAKEQPKFEAPIYT